MIDCRRLISENARGKHKYKNKYKQLYKKGTIKIDFTKKTTFGGKDIRFLLQEINDNISIYKTGFKILEIHFDHLSFIDKLTYVFLECIIYALLVDYSISTKIYIKEINTGIETVGIEGSLLTDYLADNITDREFIKRFYKIYSTKHFRKIIDGKLSDDSLVLCDLMSEIKTFLKYFNINENYRNLISEVVTELADNAKGHTKTDCLIDIDVADAYAVEREDEDINYYALNIVVVNFSPKCISDALQEKIKDKKYHNAKRYDKVNIAYNNHKEYFNSRYTETDFFNIASFQDEITGRFYENTTGGTGLTSLIKSLEENSDDHYGYVLSGDKGIIFNVDYLKYNDDNWIGFNDENDFVNKIPSKDILLLSPTYIPGTAYNFTLIVKDGGI